MNIPDRHSLLWKLVGIITLFCFLLIGLYTQQRELLLQRTAFIADRDKVTLRAYAHEAEEIWRQEGAVGVASFLARLRDRENVWADVLDEGSRSVTGQPLRGRARVRVNFMRELDWSVGRPFDNDSATIFIPFADGRHRLVMELPWHMNPRRHFAMLTNLLHLLPIVLSMLLGVLLYRIFIPPLFRLSAKARCFGAGNFAARIGSPMIQRQDEMGTLANAFDHMADRLENTIEFQRTLLHNLSHELRTPLSRLRGLNEKTQDSEILRQRLGYEIDAMERLIGNTLQFIRLNTETPDLPREEVDVAMLWDIIKADACLESGWDASRIRRSLEPEECLVQANLSGLGQTLENVLRNAIRHSPPDGTVSLSARREGDVWRIEVRDQGPGVAEDKLQYILLPFARLGQARVGDGGFGLGLSIARSMIALQGGTLWAENAHPGLRICMTLPAYPPVSTPRNMPAAAD